MKKTKQLLSLLLALCMVLSLAPLSALGVQTYYDENPAGDASGYPSYDPTTGSGPLDAYGLSLLVTSDIHGVQGVPGNGRLFNYLTEADIDAESSSILVGGDYEEGMDYMVDRAVIESVGTIIDAYYNSDNEVVVYTKGNHEAYEVYYGSGDSRNKVLSDNEFAKQVGWPRAGHVVTGYENDGSTDPAYLVYAIGWYGKNGTSSGSGGFSACDPASHCTSNLCDMCAFDAWMEEMDDKYDNLYDIPVFVISHTPIHYYSSGRNAQYADRAIKTFNQYPNVIFTWGHNHTEADPMYTNILEAGDVITWDASITDTSEILFTYAGIGSLRANGHLGEMGYRADLTQNNDGSTGVTLQYYRLEDEDTGEVGAIANATDGMDSDTTITIKDGSENTISIASVFVSPPRYGDTVDTAAKEFSSRFSVGDVSWADNDDPFEDSTAYTATVTLTAANGYTFDEESSLSILINGYEATIDSRSELEITASYTFKETAATAADSYELSADLSEGNQYVLVGGQFDALASDLTSIAAYVDDADDELVTEVDASTVWTAYSAVGGGYYLFAEGVGFLSVEMRGPDASLAVTDSPSTTWTLESDGIKSDGGYFINTSAPNLYGSSTFSLSKNADTAVKAYSYSEFSGNISFISVEIDVPVAGNAPGDAECPGDAYDIDSTTWGPDDVEFGYGTEYTATIKLSSGYDFSGNPMIIVNGVVAKAGSYNFTNGVLTLFFDRTLYLDEFNAGYYGVFIEVDDFDDDGQYVIVADTEDGPVSMTSDALAQFEGTSVLLGNDMCGYWYIDGKLLYSPTKSMVWNYEDGLLSSQDGKYLNIDEDSGVGISLSSVEEPIWTYDGNLYSDNKYIALTADGNFTAGETSGPPEKQVTPVNLTIYKLVNLVPVEVYLDGSPDYDNETELDYEDIYIEYDGKLYRSGLYGGKESFLLPYDANGSYILGVSSKYVVDYLSGDVIGNDANGIEILYAGTFNASNAASRYEAAIVNFYSINVYDGRKLVDRQIVLNGYTGERGTYTKKGYRAVLYDMTTGRAFRFDRAVYKHYDVGIEWVELESEPSGILSPASQVKSKSPLDYAQSDSDYVSPAQILAKFTDIQSHWAKNQIEFVVLRGLFNGMSEYLFAPDSPMTRGMLVTVLYRNSGNPYVAQAGGFSDVASGSYYADPIAWASLNGIVEGYGSNKFGPSDNITREQIATIIYRYAAYCKLDTTARAGLDGFKDASDVSDWALEALQWCVSTGIIQGKPGDVIDPEGYATRAEVAVILQRFITLAGF